jgi:hypothetical protein
MSDTHLPHPGSTPESEDEGGDFGDDFVDFSLIDRNSCSTVYRAVERATGRVVAVKSVQCVGYFLEIM